MVSMDFHFPSKHLYGLPHRADSFILRTTQDSDPLQLFNKDWFKHPEKDEAVNLYGSIPYITSHTASRDASILWNNAAETWVENLSAA
jgi:alpha-glucosidase (family GH31 glycosyl hydrolase)